MSANDFSRQQQLAFNEAMVQQAGGLLAPLNGAERYVTVSSGHVSQFCKAALSGCNNLNRENLSKDVQLKQMLEEGWPWLVVSWAVEEEWPDLPRLAEKALNASNQAFQSQMELEIALHIHELCKGMQQPDLHKVAMEACSAGGGDGGISKYAGSIAKWLGEFSGKGSLLQFLALFSREFGAQCNVGEEFWVCCSSSQFLPVDMPMIRLAMLATNFTSPSHKIQDNYAKLLVRSDWDKLKKLCQKPILADMEAMLFKAWNLIENQLPDLQAARSFGILCIRTTLHVLNKQQLRLMLNFLVIAEIDFLCMLP